MSEDKKSGLRKLMEKNRAVIWVLLLGAVLMLLPGGGRNVAAAESKADFDTDEEKLAAVLSRIEGVGQVHVLLQRPEREQRGGAVVVCDGADSAEVRLRIVQAVTAYTGLGSDRIVVLQTNQ